MYNTERLQDLKKEIPVNKNWRADIVKIALTFRQANTLVNTLT